ncbi:MAG TPA: hypothetical protein VGW77_24480 [Candidatus Binatia bacterium]|jgi:hypothetical protein|nr:hypothetical protein [Candidatus Binatia bacterium]
MLSTKLTGLDGRDSPSANFALGVMASGLLLFWKWPPWLALVLTAVGGELLVRGLGERP